MIGVIQMGLKRAQGAPVTPPPATDGALHHGIKRQISSLPREGKKERKKKVDNVSPNGVVAER